MVDNQTKKLNISENRDQNRRLKKQFLIIEISQLLSQACDRLGVLSHLEDGCDVEDFCDGGSK